MLTVIFWKENINLIHAHQEESLPERPVCSALRVKLKGDAEKFDHWLKARRFGETSAKLRKI